jgi:hypothetical protein
MPSNVTIHISIVHNTTSPSSTANRPLSSLTPSHKTRKTFVPQHDLAKVPETSAGGHSITARASEINHTYPRVNMEPQYARPTYQPRPSVSLHIIVRSSRHIETNHRFFLVGRFFAVRFVTPAPAFCGEAGSTLPTAYSVSLGMTKW